MKLLGIMFIVWGVLSLLFGIAAFFGLAFLGLLSGDGGAVAVLGLMAIFVGGFCIITGIPEIIGGWGLLNKKPWARTLVIVMAIINIIDPPFGTALGVYALWVLFKTESEQALAAQPTQNPTV